MKIIRDIVWSSDEPLDKNVLWLNNGLIKYYGPTGWESLKYFSMIESNMVGFIDAETHKISLSRTLPKDVYYLKYEDERGIVLDNWDDVCQMSNYSTYDELIQFNIAPYAAYAIGVYNSNGIRVGHIELGQFKPKYGKRLFRFGLLSDVHNSSDESAEPIKDIQRALKFFNDKQSVSFTCISGDLTNSASETGFSIYQKNVQESSPNTPVYATPGNHDAQSELNVERWKKYTGCEPTYEFTHTVDGIPFHFIFLGMYYWSLGTDGKPYRDEDIEWLAERLKAHKGEKCFVITHLFFPDRAGNLLEIYPQGNWLQGEQLTKLENLCKTYPNTIWFSGHSHWKWYLQKYQATENIYQNEQEGSYCVHISGCASPVDSNGQPNTSGARVTKPLESEGAIVDVYEDYIDIRCMDLKNMLYLPIAQYRLTMKKNNTSMRNLTIVESNIEPNKEHLWLYNGNIKYYSSNGWVTLGSSDENIKELDNKINIVSSTADAAKTTAIAAQNAAQEAQAVATTASDNAAQAQELATEAKTIAEQAQDSATNALSEAIEAKSNAATASGAASNALGIANAAKTKNDEQDERLVHIEENLAHLGIAGRYWNEDNATSTAENYYGSLQALRDLPKRLGLGRYLVTDDRKRKKLDPKDSTKYLDGSPAKLDGLEGQCMWCWNGFYANIWHEGSRLIKAVTFDGPVGGETSVWIPAGGISWLGAGVMDRTNQKLCSLISDAEQYRGGGGTALNPASYAKAPAADSPQITMLGMPATVISTTDFGNYARKRGEGWEANWFVARFVVEFLFEIIMGTENSQAAFNAEKDENGLYQGGFGTGVTDMQDWGGYNGTYPVIPTSVGLEAGDGVCLVPYSLPQTDGAEGEAYKTFNVPVFFGLVHAGFGSLWSWTRGVIMDAGEEKSLVYVTPSMYADYDPNTVADKIMVAECPRVSGYIKRKSYQGLCCMPTEVGGSATIRFADYYYTDVDTSKGLRVRAADGHASLGVPAGASCTIAHYAATLAYAHCSAPLCYFEEDPVIPESQSIANNS